MTNPYQSLDRTLPRSHVRPVSSHATDHVTGLVIARGCSLPPPYTKNENPRGDYSVSRSGGVGSLSVSLFLHSQMSDSLETSSTSQVLPVGAL